MENIPSQTALETDAAIGYILLGSDGNTSATSTPEIRDYKCHVFETIRRGRRFQDSIRPHIYLYHQDRADLPNGNTTVVVVVRFGYNLDGSENNFILTAYYVSRQGATSP